MSHNTKPFGAPTRRLLAPLLTAAVLALGGCATGYQSSGLTGGFTDAPGPGKTRQVFFYGNGFITPQKVQTYLIYRCAELAKEGGHKYFTIYESLSEAVTDKPRAWPKTRSIFGKPHGRAFVLFHSEPVAGALETDEVLTRLGPEVKG